MAYLQLPNTCAAPLRVRGHNRRRATTVARVTTAARATTVARVTAPLRVSYAAARATAPLHVLRCCVGSRCAACARRHGPQLLCGHNRRTATTAARPQPPHGHSAARPQRHCVCVTPLHGLQHHCAGATPTRQSAASHDYKIS